MVAALATQPKKFGRYVMLGHIADGGMASVYLAQLRGEHQFAKWVALKVVHEKHADDERFEKMFLSEARLAGRIQHPHVAQVFDFGKVDGTCFLAMEYLSGETLDSAMKRAGAEHFPFPLTLAARIISNTAMALHAAHELHDDAGHPAGVIHRDISPQNIFLLFSGQTKLMDFGIAKSLAPEDSEELTELGELKGKFAYMSPEQLTLQEIDRRSDVFALGVVLWELTCGVRLFKRRSEAETAVAVMHDRIPSPSTMRDGVPPELERIVMKALERDLSTRYQTAAELADDLEEFIAASRKAAGAPQLARLMEELFPSGKEEHSTVLRAAAELLARNEHLVSGEHPLPESDEIEIWVRGSAAEEADGTPSRTATPRVPASRRGGLAWLATAFAVLVLATGAWMVWPQQPREAETGRAAAPPEALPAERAPSEARPAAAVVEDPPEAAELPAAEAPERAAAPVAIVNAPADDDEALRERPAAPSRGRRRPARAAARPVEPAAGASPSPTRAEPEAAPSAPSAPARPSTPSPMTEFE